jgi:hypothetical protein
LQKAPGPPGRFFFGRDELLLVRFALIAIVLVLIVVLVLESVE